VPPHKIENDFQTPAKSIFISVMFQLLYSFGALHEETDLQCAADKKVLGLLVLAHVFRAGVILMSLSGKHCCHVYGGLSMFCIYNLDDLAN